MKITGPYKMDQNFIYVFVGDTKYIIAKNGDQWGSVTAGVASGPSYQATMI